MIRGDLQQNVEEVQVKFKETFLSFQPASLPPSHKFSLSQDLGLGILPGFIKAIHCCYSFSCYSKKHLQTTWKSALGIILSELCDKIIRPLYVTVQKNKYMQAFLYIPCSSRTSEATQSPTWSSVFILKRKGCLYALGAVKVAFSILKCCCCFSDLETVLTPFLLFARSPGTLSGQERSVGGRLKPPHDLNCVLENECLKGAESYKGIIPSAPLV